MNFLSAIKHAAIDYGIRRTCWQKDAILCLGNGSQSCELYWLNVPKGSSLGRGQYANDSPAKLCGPDKAFDLSPEDIAATDWETI